MLAMAIETDRLTRGRGKELATHETMIWSGCVRYSSAECSCKAQKRVVRMHVARDTHMQTLRPWASETLRRTSLGCWSCPSRWRYQLRRRASGRLCGSIDRGSWLRSTLRVSRRGRLQTAQQHAISTSCLLNAAPGEFHPPRPEPLATAYQYSRTPMCQRSPGKSTGTSG